MSDKIIHPSQPPDSPSAIDTQKPITIDALNDIWFLALALIAVVAYCVRIELGVKNAETRINRLENETIPGIRAELADIEAHFESTLHEAKKVFASELASALTSQREFIAGQTALILEKISNVKEQTDRQGRELRQFSGMLSCQKKHCAELNDD